MIEDLEHAGRRARNRARFPGEQPAEIGRVQAIDVLVGIDGGERDGLVEPLGQRQLQENTVDGPIGAQGAQQVHQLALTDALRVERVARGDADGVRRALLAADVDLRGGVLPDEDDAEGRRDPTRLLQSLDAGLDLREHALLDGLAGEDHAATRRRRMFDARPSRYQPMACDSLVASQCMSTRMIGVSFRSSGRISSALRNGQSIGVMKTRPMRLSTATRCGPAFTVTCPTPGVPAGKLAGRRSRFSFVMYSTISFLSQMWLPEVSTSAPCSSICLAIDPVTPKPPAAFSQFTTQKSIACSSRRRGRCFASAARPGSPQLSPTIKTFMAATWPPRARASRGSPPP